MVKKSGRQRYGMNNIYIYIYSMAQEPLVDQGLIIGASQSHPDTHHSVGLLWTSDQPLSERIKCVSLQIKIFI
jgi:hypothetical protein